MTFQDPSLFADESFIHKVEDYQEARLEVKFILFKLALISLVPVIAAVWTYRMGLESWLPLLLMLTPCGLFLYLAARSAKRPFPATKLVIWVFLINAAVHLWLHTGAVAIIFSIGGIFYLIQAYRVAREAARLEHDLLSGR